MLTLLPVTTQPPDRRRRGRPRLDERVDRRRQILACARLKLCGVGVAILARHYEVSPRTVLRWTGQALTWDGPEADALRRLSGARQDARAS